ncbi:MAG TPA: hypothetical protein VHS96_01920 [Bacteroidia bacterium]|nr:hypothetical protein [Bacteroidia bacterium]
MPNGNFRRKHPGACAGFFSCIVAHEYCGPLCGTAMDGRIKKTKPPAPFQWDQGLARNNPNIALRSIEVEHPSKLHGTPHSYDPIVSALFGMVHFTPPQQPATWRLQLEKISSFGRFSPQEPAFIRAIAHHACDGLNGLVFGGKTTPRKHDFAVCSLQMEIKFPVIAGQHLKLWFPHHTLLKLIDFS